MESNWEVYTRLGGNAKPKNVYYIARMTQKPNGRAWMETMNLLTYPTKAAAQAVADKENGKLSKRNA